MEAYGKESVKKDHDWKNMKKNMRIESDMSLNN